jgi:hypothetical protein
MLNHKLGITGAIVLALATAGLTATPAQATTNTMCWTPSSNIFLGRSSTPLLVSNNGTYHLNFQASDGNLVLYHGSKAIWQAASEGGTIFASSNFSGHAGQLEVEIFTGGVIWHNNVNVTSSAYRIVVQNDGNFVEYTGCADGSGRAIWQTNTDGK